MGCLGLFQIVVGDKYIRGAEIYLFIYRAILSPDLTPHSDSQCEFCIVSGIPQSIFCKTGLEMLAPCAI